MWKSFKPATAIALALGLGACTSVEGPFSVLPGPRDQFTNSSLIPNKKDIDNEMRLADASLAAGDKAGAISLYRKLAREYPFTLKPRIALGDALLAANAPQEAERAYEGALKLAGDSHKALTGLGRVELALHQPAEALAYFEHAAKLHPDDAEAQNGRAVALDQLGRHDEAQAVYLQLLAHEPSNIRVRNNYALSLALAGKYDDSADILTGLAAAPDAEARIRQNLALVYGLAGNSGQAAHVARMDLDEDAVNNNLEYFQRLRHVSSPVEKGAALLNPKSRTLPARSAIPTPAMTDAPLAPATHASVPAPSQGEETSDNTSEDFAPAPVPAPVVASSSKPVHVAAAYAEPKKSAPAVGSFEAPVPATNSRKALAPKAAPFDIKPQAEAYVAATPSKAVVPAAKLVPQVTAVAAPTETHEVAQLPAKPLNDQPADNPAKKKGGFFNFFGARNAPASKPATAATPAVSQAKPQEASAEPVSVPAQPVLTALTAKDLAPKIQVAKVDLPDIASLSPPVDPVAKIQPKAAPVKTSKSAVPAVAPESAELAVPSNLPVDASLETPVAKPAAQAPVAKPTASIAPPSGNTSATRNAAIETVPLSAPARGPAVPAVSGGQGISGSIHSMKRPRHPAVPVVSFELRGTLADGKKIKG